MQNHLLKASLSHLVAVLLDALGQQLLAAPRAVQVAQTLCGLGDQAGAEGAEAELRGEKWHCHALDPGGEGRAAQANTGGSSVQCS